MKDHFNKAVEWSNITKNKIGLPRPFFTIPLNFVSNPVKSLKLSNNFYLHKKIPIPWQSKPVFNEHGVAFNVIENNEKVIYDKNLCGYCGKEIKNSEKCLRWKGSYSSSDLIPNDFEGPLVFSDTHPLHPKCMKQAKIFCPFMRERPEEEFESGLFLNLKQNAIKYKEKFVQ